MRIRCIRAFQIHKEPPLVTTSGPHSCKDLIEQYQVKFSSFLPSILLAFLHMFVHILITVIRTIPELYLFPNGFVRENLLTYLLR